MNALLITLLASIVSRITGPGLYQFITDAVATAEDLYQSGGEKHQHVISTIINTPAFKECATWLINLAIESAVAKLRTSQEG